MNCEIRRGIRTENLRELVTVIKTGAARIFLGAEKKSLRFRS